MNEKFRNAFLSAFGCGPQGRFGRGPNRSTDLVSGSLNDSVNLGRRPYKGKIIKYLSVAQWFPKNHTNPLVHLSNQREKRNSTAL